MNFKPVTGTQVDRCVAVRCYTGEIFNETSISEPEPRATLAAWVQRGEMLQFVVHAEVKLATEGIPPLGVAS
jgi:hypothetical protein